MAADQHPNQGRRQHFHRGRRGHDRNRGDRRPSPAPQGQGGQGQEHHPDTPDVDQIIREIKARIAQRHGIELSAQQIQELAARRLEAILDPRTVKPGLLDQLRKAAGAPAEIAPAQPADPYTFEDHTIYDTHNGLLRFLRRLLNPVLKLFFNPNPIAAALNAQVTANREAARREAERERTQAEWNALHYTLLQRLVTEVSRVSLEMQSLALRVESLSARTDFTERRIRGLEAVPAPASTPSRSFDAPSPAAAGGPSPNQSQPRPAGEVGGDASSESGRRRRRRRRGRRGPGTGEALATGVTAGAPPGDTPDGDEDGFEEGPESDSGDVFDGAEAASALDVAAPEPVAEAPAAVESSFASAPEPAPPAATSDTPADASPASDTTPPADSSGS
jgi:hypothetical protein